MAQDAGKVVSMAIVGAGVVGSVIALQAARQGHTVRLFDRAAKRKGGRDRIFTINAPARKTLEKTGAWQRLPSVTPVREMKVVSPGKNILEINAYLANRAQLCHNISERGLAGVLGGLLADRSIEIEKVSEIESLSAETNQAVLIVDGKAVKAKLVVGADGAMSKVASLAGLDGPRTDFGQAAVTTMASFPGVRNTAWQWLATDGVLALLPAPGDACGAVWSLPTHRAKTILGLPGKSLISALQDATCGMVGDCQDVGEASGHTLGCQVRKFCGDRVVLAGDSAHTFHPLAGQSLCVALGGIDDLFDSIGAEDPGRQFALAHYARLRRLRVAMTANLTACLAGVVGVGHAPAAVVDLCFSLPTACASSLLPKLANAR